MLSLVFAAALAASAPAEPPAAETPAAPTAATAPAAKADKPKSDAMVCKKEAVLGSRLPTRVCLRQEEWDARRTDSRDELQKIQRGQPYQSN